MLAVYILGWSLFTGVMGLAASLAAVLALRFGCGLAQAGAYPASGSLLSRWVPFSDRAFASGIVSTGGRVGGFIAPVLTAVLIVAFVPADAPALLEPDDLLHPAPLATKLNASGDQPAQRLAAAIRSLLPADALPRAAEGPRCRALADALNHVLRLPQCIPRSSWTSFRCRPRHGDSRRCQ